jgi:ATP-dependent RNA helicase DHX8/PRP22
MKSGAVKVTQRIDFDPEDGMLPAEKEAALEKDEEDASFDVELNDNEPAFLRGQTIHPGSLSPIKVVRVPDGSLGRAAMSGSTIMKERRDGKNAKADRYRTQSHCTIS